MAFSLHVALFLLAVAALAHTSEHRGIEWEAGGDAAFDNSGSDYWEGSQRGLEDSYWEYWDSPPHGTEVETWGSGGPMVVQITSRPPQYLVNNDPSKKLFVEVQIEDHEHEGGGGTQYVEGVGVNGVSNPGGTQYIQHTDVEGVYNFGGQQYIRGTGGQIVLDI